MNNKLKGLGFIILGGGIFYTTYRDEKNRKRELTTGYIMHLKGYIGGFFLFIIGIILLIDDN